MAWSKKASKAAANLVKRYIWPFPASGAPLPPTMGLAGQLLLQGSEPAVLLAFWPGGRLLVYLVGSSGVMAALSRWYK